MTEVKWVPKIASIVEWDRKVVSAAKKKDLAGAWSHFERQIDVRFTRLVTDQIIDSAGVPTNELWF